ncbi:Ig-like domain-containing protein [Dyella koreensis]|uniref:Ig-like domain-containing protein n=1 Tax=Dyella koreensis TaxID=311235 RepID=UPI003618EA47
MTDQVNPQFTELLSTPLFNDTQESSPKIGFYLYDNVGNEQGTLYPGDTTDDNRPALSGSAAPGSTVTIYDNGQIVGTAQADANGAWNYFFTPYNALSDGQHSLVAEVNGQPGAPFVFTVDTHVPPVIVDVYDNAGSTQGDVQPGGTTDDNTPQLWGSALPGSKVMIYDNGHFLGYAEFYDDRGNWVFTPDTPLGDGQHKLTAVVDGQSSESYVINIDTAQVPAPAPVIGNVYDDAGNHQGGVQSGGFTDDNRPQLQGTAAADSLVTIYDNGNPVGTTHANEQGVWTFTPDAALSDGTHSLVAVTDGQASAPFVVNIDTHVPAPVIDYGFDAVGATGSVSSGGTTDDAHLTLSGKGTPGSVVTIYDGDHEVGAVKVSKDGSWWFKPSEALQDGTHSLVAVTDGQASAPFVVNIDTHVPAPVIDYGFDAVGATGSVSSGGTTDDAHLTLSGKGTPGSVVTIYDGDHEVGAVKVSKDGS